MIFTSFASGSSGNCTFFASGSTKILIDCGISAKRIGDCLRALGLSLSDLDAVLLTHEHSDHIKGLKRLMSAYDIPVYASEGTLSALFQATRDEYFRYAGGALMHPVSADSEFRIKDAEVCPFRVYHDSASPLGFRIEARDSGASALAPSSFRTVCVATDTGYFDDYIRDHLLYSDAALIEANHDRAMLAGGKYPLYLKRRIMSRTGHLCNNQTGKLISEIMSPRLKHVLLGHLSRENNTPGLALETVQKEIEMALGDDMLKKLDISVAPQDGMSALVEL